MRVKPRRRPTPAKPPIRWDFHYHNRPDAPARQRALIRRAVLDMDDNSVSCVYGIVIGFAVTSQHRADAAELARIKAHRKAVRR